MEPVAPLDLGPPVLLHLDRDGHECLHANAVFENVSYPPFAVVSSDGTRMQIANAPSSLTEHQSVFSQIGHGHPRLTLTSFGEVRFLPLRKLILRHCPFKGAILPLWRSLSQRLVLTQAI